MSAEFFDALEQRDPAAREAALLAALPAHLAHAQTKSRAFGQILQGVDGAAVTTREALARLPVTRKSDLLARQQAGRAAGGDALGGFATHGWGPLMQRVFASPGPIYEPEGTTRDYWRTGRALFAAGFRAGELAHNAFSYHMTPGAFILERGAHAVGCTVFPAGTGQSEQQLQAIAELKPHGYLGTPSFLRILLTKAAEANEAGNSSDGNAAATRLSLSKALVSGEACPPSLTEWFRAQGVVAYQCYATADAGLIAYETAAREGLVLDEGVLLEIVRPGTGDVVPEGEVGEVVVTVFNPDYPLVRFGTGDLSAVLPGACPTGRTNTRIKGWLGRADQTTKVRGMFVHPGQVADVVRRCPEVQRARLVVSGEMADDRMTLRAEAAECPEGLAERLAAAVRDVTKLRAEVELLTPGSLPNDGKVIEDARSYA